jgi:LemA protein
MGKINNKTAIWWGLLIVAVLAGIYVWTAYNRFVTLNESISNQWAQVESQYQRRFDLIPNLVSSVQGIMKQEQAVFGELAAARAQYSGAAGTNERAEAATQVEGALARLLAIMENYPELKSAGTVQTLMAQLEGTENRISVERMRYNDFVRSLNVMVKRIPGRWLASWFGFGEGSYFEAAEGAEEVPEVVL